MKPLLLINRPRTSKNGHSSYEGNCRAAWKNLEGMPQEQAKMIYIESVKQILPGVENEKAGGMGAVISRLAIDASADDEDDVPVNLNHYPVPYRAHTKL